MEYIKLSNGINMPMIGYGTAAIGEGFNANEMVTESIVTAIELGYRHIDTATIYNSEKSVGDAIKQSGISRKDFFLVTKVWNTELDYDATLQAFETSLKKLGTDYVDLYLIHWPIQNQYLNAWRALERLYEEGVVKAIGGSNFAVKNFQEIAASRNIKPMVNQIELHPYYQQHEIRDFCKAENVAITAWSPLGSGSWNSAPNEVKPLYDKALAQIAHEQGRDCSGQMILRWLMQLGISAIPKSQNKERMAKNIDIFNFELTEAQMNTINSLNKDFSIGRNYSGNVDFDI